MAKTLKQKSLTTAEYNAIKHTLDADIEVVLTDPPSGESAIRRRNDAGTEIVVATSTSVAATVTAAVSKILVADWAATTAIDANEIRRVPVTAGTIEAGDLIRSNTTRTTGAVFDATEAGNWTEIAPDIVTSVAGQTGVVTLAIADTGGLQTALDVKAAVSEGAWSPALMARAIDIDFEALPSGNVASAANTGSFGGNVVNATTAQQPVVGVDSIIGRKGAAFDGSNDWLESSAAWQLGASGYGIFAVFRYTSGKGYIIAEEYNADDVLYTLGFDTANNLYVGHFNGGWRKSNNAAITNGDLVVAIGNYDGVNFNIRAFGVDNTLAQTSSPDGLTTLKTRIGRRWDGAVGVADAHFNGRIFRLVVKDGAFTANEINSLEAWAVRHFGLETKVLRPVNAHTHAAGTTTAAGFLSTTDKSKLDGIASGAEVNIQPDWTQATSTADDYIKSKPTFGTASSLNVATTGNAGTGEVVKGNDTRLSDSRTPATHTHGQSDVTNLPTDLAAKQATLSSGINIKTVGGVTVLGAGDIPFPTFATSLRLMTPTDIIEDVDRTIFLLADDLPTGAVSTWGAFLQATGTAQPTVEAVATLGGRNAALFDSTSDFMESAANISLGTRYGLFAVIRTGSSIGGAGITMPILSEIYGGATVEYMFGLEGGKFGVGHYNGAWRNFDATSPIPAINTPYIVVTGYDGANLTVKIDGGTASTAAQTSDPTLTEAGVIRLGRRWDGVTGTGLVWNGHIACIVAKRGAYFTATEISQLEGFAAWHFGRVSALPAGHAYKLAPPLITT